MSNYEISYLADQDIEDIARYTAVTWGVEQAEKYMMLLDRHFKGIADGKVLARVFLKHRKELLVSRCEKHVVFHLVRTGEKPLILAVLHSKMDLLERLKERL